MNFFMWGACFLLWAAIGIACCIYDWTATYDLRVGDAVLAVVCGTLMGPVATIYVVSELLDRGKVLIPKRTRRSF